MKKRILAVLTAFVLLCACLPLGATSVSAATYGTTGDCTWTLNGTHLTISGYGAMEDYSWREEFYAPWGTAITSVTIEEGVYVIGSEAFLGCGELDSVFIPVSICAIDTGAFAGCDSLTDIYYGGFAWDSENISYGDNLGLDNVTWYYNVTMPTYSTTPIEETVIEKTVREKDSADIWLWLALDVGAVVLVMCACMAIYNHRKEKLSDQTKK